MSAVLAVLMRSRAQNPHEQSHFRNLTNNVEAYAQHSREALTLTHHKGVVGAGVAVYRDTVERAVGRVLDRLRG